MHINLWGPIYWNFLHANAEIYHKKPLQFKLEFLEFFTSLIPCTECKDHFNEYQKSNPVQETTNFIKWAFHAHNNVNHRLNKEAFTWKQYQDLYDQSSDSLAERLCSACNYTTYIFSIIVLSIVFILVILYIVYRCKTKMNSRDTS